MGARQARGPRRRRLEGDALRLGTFRSLWSSKEVDVSPSLRFLRPREIVELSRPTPSGGRPRGQPGRGPATTGRASRAP